MTDKVICLACHFWQKGAFIMNDRKFYLLNVLKGKWRLLIIEDLFTGDKQFGELKESLKGITAKILTENLQFLLKSGVIIRRSYPTFPPKVEYTLSDTGLNMKPILDKIYEWSIENYQEFKEEVTDEYYKLFQ